MSDSWWAGSWLRAGGHQISGWVDTISGHDTLVVNDGRVPSAGLAWFAMQINSSGRNPGVKCAREVMEILEAYGLTRCAHSAAVLVGCDEKTVTR